MRLLRRCWTLVAFVFVATAATAAPSPPALDGDEIVTSMPESRAPDLQITSYVGLHALAGQNVALGLRVGIRYRKKRDFYLGSEIWVAPLAVASAVYTVFTAEQSVALTDDGRITGGAAVWGGVAFPQNVPGANAQELSVGSEFFVARHIDDLARLRLMARIGYAAGRIMGLGALGVAFRL